jgi:hypothetical protein
VNSIVKAVKMLRTLSPSDFKLAVTLARPDSLKPGRPAKKKPGPKPGSKRKPKAEPEAE